MKIISLILFITLSLTVNANYDIFSYHLEIEVSGDGITEVFSEDLEEDGWIEESDKWGDLIYILGKRDIPYQNKVIKEKLSDVEFTIRKTRRGGFQACLGMAVGDWDASSDGCFYLNPGVNVFNVSGGDHTSGSWSFDGKAVVHWK